MMRRLRLRSCEAMRLEAALDERGPFPRAVRPERPAHRIASHGAGAIPHQVPGIVLWILSSLRVYPNWGSPTNLGRSCARLNNDPLRTLIARQGCRAILASAR